MKSQGYSLVEVIAVLVILALVTSVVFPNLVRTYTSYRHSTAVATVIEQISALSFHAYNEQTRIELREAGDMEYLSWISLPENWLLKINEPIIVNANGFCSGGKLTLVSESDETALSIYAPYCRTSITGESLH